MKLYSKYLFCLGLSALALLSKPVYSNQPDSAFTIKGYLAGEQQPKKIYLRYNQQVDSMILDKGHFEFRGYVSNPVYAQLWCEEKTKPGYGNSNFVSFYLDPTEVLVTSIESLPQAIVNGGPTEAEQQVWNKMVKSLNEKRGDLFTRKYNHRDNEDSVLFLTAELKKVTEDINQLQLRFIKGFPGSYISYELVKSQSYAIDPSVLGPMLTAISPKYRNTEETKDMIKRMSIAEKTWIGKPALEFTQPDVNGQPVSLKSFRGKYVLIDFWASWCGFCRLEHPNMRKQYEKYKDKGFTILGVSQDDEKDKNKWIAAIKEDNIPWQQVSDLKGRNNEVIRLYGIKGIPQNVLVDPNGIIVAKNLRGDELTLKLHELLGKQD